MQDFIGILPFTRLFDPSFLRREALIFRRFAVPGCHSLQNTEILREVIDEYDWLMDRGIVFDPGKPDPNEWQNILSRFKDHDIMKSLYELETGPKDPKQISQALAHQGMDPDGELIEMAQLFIDMSLYVEYILRPVSSWLREHKGIDAYPIFTFKPIYPDNIVADKTDVIEIVLSALPVPSVSVPWEQIEEYRSDPDTAGKFMGLRNWMNEVARAKLTPSEVEDKLEWLLYNYQRHLELHRMKVETSTFETVVVSAAELLEDVAKLNLGKAAKGLFSLKHRRIALLEGELNAPGSEIAYISKTKETFSV